MARDEITVSKLVSQGLERAGDGYLGGDSEKRKPVELDDDDKALLCGGDTVTFNPQQRQAAYDNKPKDDNGEEKWRNVSSSDLGVPKDRSGKRNPNKTEG